MLKRYILFLKKRPLITAALAIAYAMVCLKTIPTESFFQGFLMRTLLCGGMIFFLYQISGEKTLLSYAHSTGYVIKVTLPLWLFALPVGIFGFLVSAGTGTPVREDAMLQLLIGFLMFLFVGLFEEIAFRAVINDAIICRFREKKYVFVLSAVVCSLVFGVVHVIGADLSTPLAWAQVAGKTVSAGLFGLVLIILYWKTRNIWACGVVHGVFDFLAAFSMCIFENPGKIGNYVVPDESAVAVLIVYAIESAVELLALWIVWRKVGRKINYQELRETW